MARKKKPQANPDTDLRAVTYSWDGVKQQLTIAVKVTALGADTDPPPPGAVGEAFDASFTFGGTGYYARLRRTLTGGSTFSLRTHGSGTAGSSDTTVATGLTGTFDAATSTATVVVPATKVKDGTAVLGTGATIGGLSATSWQDQGGVLLRDDDAGATCTGLTLS